MPKALRIKGEALVSADKADRVNAAGYFQQSGELAHRQGALAWILRAATSLARLRQGQNRVGEARASLASVYDRFTEGFDAADLKAAKALLDALAVPAAHADARFLTSSPLDRLGWPAADAIETAVGAPRGRGGRAGRTERDQTAIIPACAMGRPRGPLLKTLKFPEALL
jgi:hypothetical protein